MQFLSVHEFLFLLPLATCCITQGMVLPVVCGRVYSSILFDVGISPPQRNLFSFVCYLFTLSSLYKIELILRRRNEFIRIQRSMLSLREPVSNFHWSWSWAIIEWPVRESQIWQKKGWVLRRGSYLGISVVYVTPGRQKGVSPIASGQKYPLFRLGATWTKLAPRPVLL